MVRCRAQRRVARGRLALSQAPGHGVQGDHRHERSRPSGLVRCSLLPQRTARDPRSGLENAPPLPQGRAGSLCGRGPQLRGSWAIARKTPCKTPAARAGSSPRTKLWPCCASTKVSTVRAKRNSRMTEAQSPSNAGRFSLRPGRRVRRLAASDPVDHRADHHAQITHGQRQPPDAVKIMAENAVDEPGREPTQNQAASRQYTSVVLPSLSAVRRGRMRL